MLNSCLIATNKAKEIKTINNEMDFSHEFSRINTNLKSALVDFK
jgi:hypothetical protein